MTGPRCSDRGFTLVELMVVVLIIGILVTIAVPVYTNASANAQVKACQSNQRMINGAVALLVSIGGNSTMTAGEFVSGGSGWYGALIPGWIKNHPTCPLTQTNYYLNAAGVVTGDLGVPGFNTGHPAP